MMSCEKKFFLFEATTGSLSLFDCLCYQQHECSRDFLEVNFTRGIFAVLEKNLITCFAKSSGQIPEFLEKAFPLLCRLNCDELTFGRNQGPRQRNSMLFSEFYCSSDFLPDIDCIDCFTRCSDCHGRHSG